MSWITAFYLTNTASGLLLAVLGWFAAVQVKPVSRALSFFLVAFGAQFVLSNTATAASTVEIAGVLFLGAVLLGPLQALLVLVHAHQASRPGLRWIAAVAVWLVLASILTGSIVAFFVPGSVLTVGLLEAGGFRPVFGWAHGFFHVAQFVGVPFALFLTALNASPADRRDWRLLAGTALAVAWSYGWTLGYALRRERPDSLLVALVVALVLLAGVAVRMALRAHHANAPGARGLALAILAACIVAPLAEWPDTVSLWFVGSPGLWRLVAASLVVAPVLFVFTWRPIPGRPGYLTTAWHVDLGRGWPQLVLLPFIFTAAIIGALGLLGLTVGQPWRALQVSAAVAAHVGIILFAFIDLRRSARAAAPKTTEAPRSTPP